MKIVQVVVQELLGAFIPKFLLQAPRDQLANHGLAAVAAFEVKMPLPLQKFAMRGDLLPNLLQALAL